MEPFEIMVSESQERMLAVVEPRSRGRGARGLRALGDGRGGDRRGHRLRARSGSSHGERWSATCRCRRSSTSARSTTSSRRAARDGCYGERAHAWRRAPSRGRDPAGAAWPRPPSPASAGPSSSTTRSSARAPCAARRPPTRRCSQIPEAGAAIAVSIDGNGRRVACDPYLGTIEAVLECAANLACVGAEPLGLTNCLNFGNPEKPAVAWQLDRSTQGLADACEALGDPGRRRQRLASTTRPTGGRSTRRPSSAWSASCPTAARGPGLTPARGGRDRPGRAVRALAGGLGAGEAARRARARGCPRTDLRDVAAARSGCVREARAGGGLQGDPRHQRGRPRDGAGGVRDRRRCRARGGPRRAGRGAWLLRRDGACSARAPAASCIAGAPDAVASAVAAANAADVPAFEIGGATGGELRISAAEAEIALALGQATRAWGALADRMGEPVSA